ncbi:MarR family winged helix-turn-helix transcriptional regulator [Arthrobacter sp. ISL-5]|uniref:MarR family winged helix-turn-helix transcriptional regulator n=1 Tax=Arthrobacter sp. ISL-5 TaxID=2819111 RepID=UPI001BE5FEBE|nr:MarR family transcriptional regulator [Arthrobacter sp. ISL-5]MBT2553019.1 MarR family transcriptional regulator [Arthrobacter sp. ISL-5]
MPQPSGVKLKLGLLLRQSHGRAAGALNTALSGLGLTGRHFGVMMLLDRDGISTQRDLIRETGSDKAGMTRTVEDLEKLGYLSRTQSTVDKRVANLTLTEGGRAAFNTAKRLAGATAEELFAPFTQAELEMLESMLARFIQGTGPGDGPLNAAN